MQIHDDVAAAINDQIQKEFASAYLYLSMAAHFESLSLSGFAHWMRHQADEEKEHAMRLFDYLNERGGRVRLQGLEQPQIEFGSVREVVEMVADHERKVTASIYALYDVAVKHKDYATQSHLNWFVDEQVEEEASADSLVDMVRMSDEGDGRYLFIDHRLSKRGADH